MNKITRRTFLKQLGAGGVGLAALLCGGWRLFLSPPAEENRCPVCGALFHRPGVWGKDSAQDYFCPACGVQLRTGKKQMDWSAPHALSKTHSKKQVAWDLGEFPFPNPVLVQQTDKPIASLKQLTRKPWKGFTEV